MVGGARAAVHTMILVLREEALALPLKQVGV
jgi:hypothetical protein